ncbi:hypothetical protein KIL84_006229 [Mauremys mutica]|uniref:Sushi domain-containing protein n=1 Tax=Mauremys mutica TaxID=74926 RepID=A0A9D4AVV4_9SAUR|nr:hypothetical protein KIL84_006229 [Mauremys mutica]
MSPGLPGPALALGLLALLLLLLPGTRSDCGPLPKLNYAIPSDMDWIEGFPVDTQVTYKCRDGFFKIPGKSDTVVCLSNSQWSNINEFCGQYLKTLSFIPKVTKRSFLMSNVWD